MSDRKMFDAIIAREGCRIVTKPWAFYLAILAAERERVGNEG